MFQSFFPIQLFLGYSFILSGLIVNTLQFLTWIGIRPFHQSLYRQMNYYLATLIWSRLTFIYTYWSNSKITFYCDRNVLEDIKQEDAIYLPNHRYEIDWLIALVFNQYLGCLGGTKIVGKHSLIFIPVLGYSWLFTESIFLRRIWQNDRTILERDIQKLVNNYPKNYHFNIIMTCEGTRYTEEKRIESMRYAREKGLSELKYHILPRTKGLTLIMQGAKGKIPAVYNFVLGFSKDSAPPTLRTLLNGHSCRAHVYFKRISMSEIPYEDEKQSAQWIHKLFQEKDKIYDYFLEHDAFDAPRLTPKRNYHDLIIEIFWFFTIGIPSLIWLLRFIMNSSFVSKCIFGTILFIIYIILRWMIDQSVIKIEKKNK